MLFMLECSNARSQALEHNRNYNPGFLDNPILGFKQSTLMRIRNLRIEN